MISGGMKEVMQRCYVSGSNEERKENIVTTCIVPLKGFSLSLVGTVGFLVRILLGAPEGETGAWLHERLKTDNKTTHMFSQIICLFTV